MLGRVPDDVRVSDRLTIPAAELSWRFSRSSGPGGQGVNTTDSRVELSWDLAGSPMLPAALRDRAIERLGDRLVNGVLTVTASEHRSQLRNRDAAVRWSGGSPTRNAAARSNATAGRTPATDHRRLNGATVSRFSAAARGPSNSSQTRISRPRNPAARRANSRWRATYSALPSGVSIFTGGWP
jgi:ribosome-associated protein